MNNKTNVKLVNAGLVQIEKGKSRYFSLFLFV